MYMKSLQAAAGFLGADVNNLVFVQNATTGKKPNADLIQSWMHLLAYYHKWVQIFVWRETYIFYRCEHSFESFPVEGWGRDIDNNAHLRRGEEYL